MGGGLSSNSTVNICMYTSLHRVMMHKIAFCWVSAKSALQSPMLFPRAHQKGRQRGHGFGGLGPRSSIRTKNKQMHPRDPQMDRKGEDTQKCKERIIRKRSDPTHTHRGKQTNKQPTNKQNANMPQSHFSLRADLCFCASMAQLSPLQQTHRQRQCQAWVD